MTIEEIDKAYYQGKKQGWADKNAWIKERVRRLKKGMRKEGYKETAEDIDKIIDKVFEIK